MAERKIGFPPVVGRSPVVLILGSMPGEESLRKQEYYGHPQNAFWTIMSHILSFDPDIPYRDRTRALRRNGIALWDVLKSCWRDGSLDASIHRGSAIANPIAGFLMQHRSIRALVFNGARAEEEFRRKILPQLGRRADTVKLVRMPSTSPAMAMMSREAKCARWAEGLLPVLSQVGKLPR